MGCGNEFARDASRQTPIVTEDGQLDAEFIEPGAESSERDPVSEQEDANSPERLDGQPVPLGRAASWVATIWIVGVAILYLAVREVGFRVVESPMFRWMNWSKNSNARRQKNSGS